MHEMMVTLRVRLSQKPDEFETLEILDSFVTGSQSPHDLIHSVELVEFRGGTRPFDDGSPEPPMKTAKEREIEELIEAAQMLEDIKNML